MLLVNWTPVAVVLPPPPPPPPSSAQRYRGGPVARGCGGPGGDGHAAARGQQTCRGRPAAQPQPSPSLWRKLREARDRSRLKRRWMSSDGRRTHAEVQCERAAPPEPEARSAQHDAAQTDLEPGYVRRLLRPGRGDRAASAAGCKTGVDAATQVCHRDLVDFETESARLAGLLVADALGQAAVRVAYEDDAAALRREQAVYVARRRAERVETHRLEHAEAARRRRGLRALAEAERADPGPAYRAVHARALADHYADSLCAAAVRQLESDGYLLPADGRRSAADAWLRERLRDRARRLADVRLDAIVGDTIADRPQVRHDRGPAAAGAPRDDDDAPCDAAAE